MHSFLLPEASRKGYLISTNGLKWTLRQCESRRVVQSVKYSEVCPESYMWAHFMVVQAVLDDILMPKTNFEYIHHNLVGFSYSK